MQLQTEVWKRYLETMRSVKWEESRKKQSRMIGHKEAATEQDKMGLSAVCIWTGSLENAEFMNLFQGMVMNCGRGSDIGISNLSDFSLKQIKEDNGVTYDTLQQYVLRPKTLGKMIIFRKQN